MEKLCAFCEHFVIEGGYADTYGYGGEDYPECRKNMWDKLGTSFFTFRHGREDDFREMLLTAQKCPKYKQVKTDSTLAEDK